MYSDSKLGAYQNTANMLKNASSYREVLVPVSDVAIQFAELLNEVKNNANSQCNEKENGFEAPAEKKNKGGRKPKGD